MTNNKTQITSKFTLEKRTTDFSIALLRLLIKLPKTDINNVLIKQVSRSGTSIGANYHEANESSSTKDFTNLIRISKKECKETLYWLRIIDELHSSVDAMDLLNEVYELSKIFSAIYNKITKIWLFDICYLDFETTNALGAYRVLLPGRF